jgi:hypothetical protein
MIINAGLGVHPATASNKPHERQCPIELNLYLPLSVAQPELVEADALSAKMQSMISRKAGWVVLPPSAVMLLPASV